MPKYLTAACKCPLGSRMPEIDAMDRRTREARLLVSRPEVVFEELKKYASQIKTDRSAFDDELEMTLAGRDDPLINLGLACYASNEEVVGKLYKKAVAPPTHRRTPAIGKAFGSRVFRINQFL